MKKIILTGVVLLLLILLAVDFYVTRRSDEKPSTANIATLSDNSAATAAAPSATIDESATNTIAQERTTAPEYAAATTTRKRMRRDRTRTHVTTVVTADAGTSVAYEPVDDGGITVIMDKDEPIAAETPKTYLGFNPPAPEEKKAAIVDPKRHMLHFGVEGGVMHNNYNSNHAQNDMLHVGFYAGILADVAFNDHLALQPGVRYAMKGTGVENTFMSPNQDVTIKDMITLHYLEVPVNFVVKFGDRENARFMVGAGPYAAYLLRATDKYEMTTTTYGNTNPAARTTAAPDESKLDGKSTVTQGTYNLQVGSKDASNTSNANMNNGTMRTIDWGVGGFVGVETPGGFFIKAGTEQGLTNVKVNPDGRYSGQNSNFFVSLGTLIGYRK